MENAERDLPAEVAKIFTSAGWTAGDKFEWETGAFHAPNLLAVGGIDPTGTPRSRAVRTDLVTDALWLVEHARQQANPLTTEATLDPVALQSEEVENPGDESNGETGEVFDASAGGSDGPSAVFDTADGNPEDVLSTGFAQQDSEVDGTAIFDADFTEGEDLGSEILDAHDTILEGGDPWSTPELPAPEPEDFAPDEIADEDHSSGAFIFGDNLAHDRIVRIGQLAEKANALIDTAKQGYSEAEHNAVRSHVVTNMNEAGSYVGGDQGLFNRFIELEGVTARVSRIELYRDERQDFIRSADRDAVASFDPEAGWP